VEKGDDPARALLLASQAFAAADELADAHAAAADELADALGQARAAVIADALADAESDELADAESDAESDASVARRRWRAVLLEKLEQLRGGE
jgi:hypothetical protein